MTTRELSRRVGAGILTLLVVSIIVFLATQVLPGNAAYAVLGRTATPQRLKALEAQLHLNRPMLYQYWTWVTGLFTGHLGTSLASGQPVWSQVGPRLLNSAVLVAVAGFIGTLLGLAIGAVSGLRRDGLFDHATSVVSLVITALPEFVVAIGLIIVLATDIWHVLPAVSIANGGNVWAQPRLLLLPIATLVIVIVPYIHRMTRAAVVEALESDYVQMARLKGLSETRVVVGHALPNAIAPVIQVIGLTLLYLAGGIVVVEAVFDYPGIGQGLVNAVSARDIPVIQLTVVILAAFYVVINIATDVIALVASPRRRSGRRL